MEFVAHMIAQALQRIAEGDAAVWSTAWRTIRLAVESTAFALALGLPAGVWLGRRARAPAGPGWWSPTPDWGCRPSCSASSSR